MKQTGISRSLSQSLRLGIAAMALTVSAAAFAQATYVLGCSLPLSGRMMGFGEPMRVGAEVAVEEMNKSPKNKGL
jgi:ABC-type branched-subunit amino acid transport system substrate-binding protein